MPRTVQKPSDDEYSPDSDAENRPNVAAQSLSRSNGEARNVHALSAQDVDNARAKGVGVAYYGYRWYDPLTGRSPSRDPIGEAGGSNLYCITRNAVTNRTDLLGLYTIGPAIKKDWIDRVKLTLTSPLVGIIGNKIYNDVYWYSDNDDYIVEDPRHEVGVRAKLDERYVQICAKKHPRDGTWKTISVDPGETVSLYLWPEYPGMLARIETADFWLGKSDQVVAVSGTFDCCFGKAFLRPKIANRHVVWDWKDVIDANVTHALKGQDLKQIIGESLVWWFEVWTTIEYKITVTFVDRRP
ncbi:MAG: hypothetical protein K9M97_09555 [Akkermansiaceae bacterium]|nr:hypothetical protein [Akkermansiaceae bacterium]